MKVYLLILIGHLIPFIFASAPRNSRKLFNLAQEDDLETAEIFKSDPIIRSYYSDAKSTASRNLSLFDISNVVYKVAADRNLKITSQQHKSDGSEYGLHSEVPSDYTLKINNIGDQFEYNFFNDKGKMINTLKTSNKNYMTNEFAVFLNKSIDGVGMTGRKLINVPEKLKNVSDKFVDYLNTLKKVDGILKAETGESTSVVSFNDITLFTVTITGLEDNLRLVISNTPSSGEFKDFRLNHFEYIRNISLDEDETSLQHYFESIRDNIIGKIIQVVKPTNYIRQIYNRIVRDLDPVLSLHATDWYGLDHDEYVIFDVFRQNDNKKKIADVQIYPIETQAVYGLSINKAEETVVFTLPVQGFSKFLTTLKIEIEEILNEDQIKLYDFDGVKTALNDSLLSFQCIMNKVDVFDNESKIITNNANDDKFHIGFYEFDDSTNGQCEAKTSIFRFELLSYGFVQYLHISLDNELLTDEFMIAVNGNFITTLNRSLAKFFRDIKTVRENRDKENQPQVYTFDELVDLVQKTLQPFCTCQIKFNNLDCSRDTSGKNVPVLTVVNIDKGDNYKFFRVTFINDNPNVKDQMLNAEVKEVNIPVVDNAAAVDTLIDDIKSLISQNSE